MPKDELVQARVSKKQKKAYAHAAAMAKKLEAQWMRDWLDHGAEADLSQASQ